MAKLLQALILLLGPNMQLLADISTNVNRCLRNLADVNDVTKIEHSRCRDVSWPKNSDPVFVHYLATTITTHCMYIHSLGSLVKTPS